MCIAGTFTIRLTHAEDATTERDAGPLLRGSPDEKVSSEYDLPAGSGHFILTASSYAFYVVPAAAAAAIVAAAPALLFFPDVVCTENPRSCVSLESES